MKQMFVLGTMLLATIALPSVAADLIDGDADAGKNKALACAACHGADGNSIANPEWPNLAGQHAGYVFEQLQHFKGAMGSTPRWNAVMSPMAAGLSEQDMKDLAAYFAQQPAAQGRAAADAEKLALGEKIYRGGIESKQVAACIACHGPAGEGNAAARYPRISGQHAAYLVNQLKAYRLAAEEPDNNNGRRSDPGQMMRNIAADMSDKEMEAVANYMQGLTAAQ